MCWLSLREKFPHTSEVKTSLHDDSSSAYLGLKITRTAVSTWSPACDRNCGRVTLLTEHTWEEEFREKSPNI